MQMRFLGFFFSPRADFLSAQSTWKSRLNLKMKCGVLLFIYDNEKSERLVVDKLFRYVAKKVEKVSDAVLSEKFYFHFIF